MCAGYVIASKHLTFRAGLFSILLPRIATPKKMIDCIFKLQPQRTSHTSVWAVKAEMSNV
jgi:hypothetical protein